jgi:RHS repeat-associated protein
VTGTNTQSAITGTDATTYTHDANGNITGIDAKTLTYNQDNRLVNVVESGTTLGEYTYNGLGQRVKKVAGGTTTIFHYDFNGNIIGESSTGGTFSKEYLYNDSNRLAMVDVGASKVYYYGNDQLGTPQILTDSTNTLVWEAVYIPFGEAEVNTHSTVVSNFRFPGQYYDSETGLHYNYHRYYDPSTGRYLTPDPIGIDAGINLFAYVENNPTNDTDPYGLQGAVPAPTLVPLPLPPVVIPGTPANDAFVKSVTDLIEWFKEKLNKDDCEAEVVYRVFGGVGAKLYGRSWTPVDPRTVKNYRDVAGLPNKNTGRYLATGLLIDKTGVVRKMADPLDENIGGLPEYLVPNPQKQIEILSAERLTPQY